MRVCNRKTCRILSACYCRYYTSHVSFWYDVLSSFIFMPLLHQTTTGHAKSLSSLHTTKKNLHQITYALSKENSFQLPLSPFPSKSVIGYIYKLFHALQCKVISKFTKHIMHYTHPWTCKFHRHNMYSFKWFMLRTSYWGELFTRIYHTEFAMQKLRSDFVAWRYRTKRCYLILSFIQCCGWELTYLKCEMTQHKPEANCNGFMYVCVFFVFVLSQTII